MENIPADFWVMRKGLVDGILGKREAFTQNTIKPSRLCRRFLIRVFYKELYIIGSYPFIVYNPEHTEGDVSDDSDDELQVEGCRNEFCLTCL